jgi:hypothetical protein
MRRERPDQSEVASNGVLVLRDLPFAAGERVAVRSASLPQFQAMRADTEQVAAQSSSQRRPSSIAVHTLQSVNLQNRSSRRRRLMLTAR